MSKLQICTFGLMIYSNLAFAQDTTYFDSDWKPCQRINSHYYRIDNPTEYGYQRIDYFTASNQIQMTGNFISLDPEMKTGQFQWYHANGSLKHIGNYLENKETGEHIWYFENGHTEAIEHYENGTLQGEFKEFHTNGNLSITTSFDHGIQNGFTRYYREDGSLHSEGMFKEGDRDGTWKYFDEKGNIIGTTDYKTDYVISEASIFLKLPNSEWSLTEKIDGQLTQYYFKRNAVTDNNGNEIIPAIMVFVEDASSYEKDVTTYSIQKQKPFREKGVQVNKIMIHENEDFPLSFKNAYFIECAYHSQGLDHVLYMVHIITDQDKGIQIYLDMTSSISSDYLPEFWTTIKAIRLNK